MRKKKILKVGKQVGGILLLGFIYLKIYQKLEVGIPCVINKLTGWKCPGCGMTHAMAEIWQGNFIAAMEYNALSLTVFPCVCIYLLYRSWRGGTGENDSFYIWEYAFLVVVLVITIGYAYLRNQV